MFSKLSPKNQQLDNAQIEDVISMPEKSIEVETKQQNGELVSSSSTSDRIELVNIVERISVIISPYFIALIGLYLYEKNSFIGTILIAVGIVSLLKISSKDAVKFWQEIKNFFGLNDK